MKKITILLIVAAALVANAANLTVGWDVSPATDLVGAYKLYSIVGTNRTLLFVGQGSVAPIVLTNGIYQLAVTATNSIGESDLSLPLYVFVSGTNVVAITAKPGAPINLQLR